MFVDFQILQKMHCLKRKRNHFRLQNPQIETSVESHWDLQLDEFSFFWDEKKRHVQTTNVLQEKMIRNATMRQNQKMENAQNKFFSRAKSAETSNLDLEK